MVLSFDLYGTDREHSFLDFMVAIFEELTLFGLKGCAVICEEIRVGIKLENIFL